MASMVSNSSSENVGVSVSQMSQSSHPVSSVVTSLCRLTQEAKSAPLAQTLHRIFSSHRTVCNDLLCLAGFWMMLK